MSPDAIGALATLLGHRLGDGTVRAYQSGAQRAAEELQLPAAEVVRRALARDRRAYEALLASVTVPETYFFRTPEHFALAAAHAQAALTAGRPLRAAWSVGCSTGEEAYSLAQALLPHSPALRVVGSDVSPRALETGRRARYGAWSFRQTTPERLGCEAVEGGWRIPERLRAAVTFHEANLAQTAWALPAELRGGVDVIFCRNLLLYFAPDPTARLLATLVDALAEGGLLVLGALEVPQVLPSGLERIAQGDGAAFRKVAPRALRPLQPRAKQRARAAAVPPEPLAHARALAEAGQLRAALAELSRQQTPEAWELAASLCIELGETEQAASLLRQVVAAEPSRVGAQLRLALLASRGGEANTLAESLDALERLCHGKSADAELEAGGIRVGYVRTVLAELAGGWRETGS